MESKDSLWLQGTRRYTRSVSNQEREAKMSSTQNEKKNSESPIESDSKKKESIGGGHIVRGQNNEVLEYVTEDGVSYKVFDSAYVATERSDHPYSISTIQEIKPSKKGNAVVVLKWFYRPSEVPDSVYQMLVKDRLDNANDQDNKDLILNTEIRNRELFASDEEDLQVFSVSALRGKCFVKFLHKFQQVKEYNLVSDSFFYVLGYNPNTRRLTNVQGEVKVGSSHQWTASTRGVLYKAVIPDCMPLPPSSKERVNNEYEELIWEPRVNDCDLIMYLRSARSMAAFAGMCDGGSTEEGCAIASRDETTINALNVLFQCHGNARTALQALVKKPLPLTIERKWTEDQVKRFQKGLRQNGKNFYKIRKDHLPNKDTSELVEFYYLWKKVQDSLMVLPQSKLRRQAVLKRTTKISTPSAENGDGSSSDNESVESDDSGKDAVQFRCKKCNTTTSDDWDVGGKKDLMLCTKCRITFKKYGVDTALDIDLDNQTPSDFGETERRTPLSSLFPDSSDIQPPPFMFKPIKEKLKGEPQESSTPQDDYGAGSESFDSKRMQKRRWKKEENDDFILGKRIKNEPKESDEPGSTRLTKTPLSGEEFPSNLERVKLENPTERFPEPSSATVVTSVVSTPKDISLNVKLENEGPEKSQRYFLKESSKENVSAQNTFRSKSDYSHQYDFAHSLKINPHFDSKSSRPSVVPPRLGIPPFSQLSSEERIRTSLQSSSSLSPAAIKQSSNPSINQNLPKNINSRLTESDPKTQMTKAPENSTEPPSSLILNASTRDVLASSDRSSPPEVVCIEEDSPLTLGILPEHHVTIPANQEWPLRYNMYQDNLPELKKNENPIIVFEGRKVKLSSYRDYLCSRTDFFWVSPKIAAKRQGTEKQFSQQKQIVPSQNCALVKPISEKDRDVPKSKPKADQQVNTLADHVSVKREPIRPHSGVPTKVSTHVPSHGRISTPINVHTPAAQFDLTKHPASHSSPYPGLNHPHPALDPLRQYPNMDPNREPIPGLLPNSPYFPYHMAVTDRDLRERELRERELRERMPKQVLHHAKLFEALDHQAAAAVAQASLPGVHHGAIAPGLVNMNQQAVLDQIRQNYSVMGLPGPPQLLPGGIPAFPPVLPANPDAEASRIAAAQRIAAEQYRMDLLQNHQHSHIHSHLHVHPQNPPPAGGSVFPPNIPALNDPLISQYALALQQNSELSAAGVDHLHAAAMNPVISGIRPSMIPTPGLPVVQQMMTPADPSLLLASHQIQQAVHESLLEQQRAIQQQQQQDYLMKLMYSHKP